MTLNFSFFFLTVMCGWQRRLWWRCLFIAHILSSSLTQCATLPPPSEFIFKSTNNYGWLEHMTKHTKNKKKSERRVASTFSVFQKIGETKEKETDTHHSFTYTDWQESHRAHSVRICILLFVNGCGTRARNNFSVIFNALIRWLHWANRKWLQIELNKNWTSNTRLRKSRM